MATMNGIDTTKLTDTIEAVKQNPGLGQARFSSKVVWSSGFASKAEISDFELGGGRIQRGRTFAVTGDHPPALLGKDSAPAAVESLIAAAGQCVAGGWATFGAAMGIPLDCLEIELRGELDLQGFMGIGKNARAGLTRIAGKIYVKSAATDEQLSELKKTAESHSPVVDSLRVPVELELVRVK
jgi:uncharacterized OsmC-like protein